MYGDNQTNEIKKQLEETKILQLEENWLLTSYQQKFVQITPEILFWKQQSWI